MWFVFLAAVVAFDLVWCVRKRSWSAGRSDSLTSGLLLLFAIAAGESSVEGHLETTEKVSILDFGNKIESSQGKKGVCQGKLYARL